ncbi:MAG: Acinetobacter phage Ac42 [Pseudomonadota bacterium]|jgi:hypothetical protein
MNLNIKNSIKHTLNNAGISIVPTVLSAQKLSKPMAYYQAMDFTKLDRAQAALGRFIGHVASGQCRAIAVTGPAGSGKTSSVVRMLKTSSATKYKVIAGALSPIQIYSELYRHKNPGEVIVLDDVDSVYKSIEGKNVLKAAADTIAQRKISWLTATPILKAWGIPNSYDYNGSLVLISNETLAAEKGNKLGAHLKAIIDRLHPVKMGSNNKDEQFHHLCYYIVRHGLLRSLGLSPYQEAEILQYITDHFDRIPSITLRVAIKLADLIMLEPECWQEMAAFSLLDD